MISWWLLSPGPRGTRPPRPCPGRRAPPAAPEELHGLALGQGLEVDVRASSHMSLRRAAGDLLGQLVVQGIDERPDVVLDVADVQVLSAAEPGVDDLVQVGQDVDDTSRLGRAW